MVDRTVAAVKDSASRTVFQRLERNNKDAPHNLWQVQNKKYCEKKKDREGRTDQPLTKGNLVCQIQQVETLLQEHPFIQRVWHGKGVVPSVVLHIEQQMLDLKGFCCSTPAGQTTVLGFDKLWTV